MRSVVTSLLVVLVAMALLSCSGSKSVVGVSAGDIPDWFSNLPDDPNYFFAANTATSKDLQLAIDKAATGGRAEIGRQVEVKISALQKRFDEEVGLGKDSELLQQFTQASKTVVSTSLSGSRIAKTKTLKDGEAWRAYALISYPIGAANEALLQQLKNNNNLYTRFRASEVFKELEDEVQKYEAFKKQQAPTN